MNLFIASLPIKSRIFIEFLQSLSWLLISFHSDLIHESPIMLKIQIIIVILNHQFKSFNHFSNVMLEKASMFENFEAPLSLEMQISTMISNIQPEIPNFYATYLKRFLS